MLTRGLDDFEGCPCLPAWTKDPSFTQLLQPFRARLKLLMPPSSIIDKATTQFQACIWMLLDCWIHIL